MDNKYEVGKIYILNKFMALVLLVAPDTGKILYNIFEHRRRYHSYDIMGNGYTFEEAAIKAFKYLAYYMKHYDQINEALDNISNQRVREGESESDYIYDQIEIDENFCKKEMNIPENQIYPATPPKWNCVRPTEDGSWGLGSR